MQTDLRRAVERTDAFAGGSDALRSPRAVVVPHLSQTSKSAQLNAPSAALLAHLKAESAVLRHRAAELALDTQKLAEWSE
jgi:hypothetical protein